MLVPVHQQQTRFTIPGLRTDERGIVVGPRVAVYLPSLDRVVALLGVLSNELRSEDLFAGLAIHRVRSALGGLDFLVITELKDPHLIDRVSAVASLHGGEVLVGEQHHFVRYRDRRSPLGYDVDRLARAREAGEGEDEEEAPDGDGKGWMLYGRITEGLHRLEETLTLRSLLVRIPPRPSRRPPQDADDLLVMVRRGLRGPLERTLWRSRIEGRVARMEQEDGTEVFLYALKGVSLQLAGLLQRTPGFEVFVAEGELAAVERGQVHPIDLAACGQAFEGRGMHLFRGGNRPVLVLPESPAWTPLADQVDPTVLGTPLPLAPATPAPASGVDLRLVPKARQRGEIAAIFVPRDQLPLLRHLVYLLPPSALVRYRAVAVEEGVLIVSDQGPVEELPVGVPLQEAAPSVYVPVGHTFRPQVPPEVITEALEAEPGQRVVFVTPEGPPLSITSGFQLLGRGFLDAPEPRPTLVRPDTAPKRPRLVYPRVGPFPLWQRAFPEPGEEA
ncbi:MAG: hypothetical protein P1V51_06040 [Deltaproteobacteria bacterium]|nr:hypothetical protein [Deltaproteobacteria bacterium]